MTPHPSGIVSRPPLRRGGRLLAAFLGGALLLLLTVAAEAQTKEHQVKAAFLYNFTKFVEWPAGKMGNPGAPIEIGVFGHRAFAETLAESVRGRRVNGRSIRVRDVRNAAEVMGVHVLFVPATSTRAAAGFEDAIRRGAVLAVGETPGFLHMGGTIAFGIESGKVRFDINLSSARAAGLKINAQLLRLARSVSQDG